MRGSFTVTCLLLLAQLPLAGCGVGEAKVAADEPAPLPVEGVTVSVNDLYASYNATATLAADGEARVPARVGGQVVEILVEEGDPVVPGQVLARLDGERLRLAMREAEAELARVRKFDSPVKLGLRNPDLGDQPRPVAQAKGGPARLELLTDADLATRDDPADRRTNFRVAEIEPFEPPGGVQRCHLEFQAVSRLIAEIRVPQTELYRFREGQTVRLAVDALERSVFEAVVDRISPTIDTDTGTFGVTSYIDNADGLLAPGMFARLSVAYETYEDALTLPASAIVEEDGENVVYVVADGVAERRIVVPGVRERGLVQIVSGVSEGESVIRNAGGVRDGIRVVMAAFGSAAAGA